MAHKIIKHYEEAAAALKYTHDLLGFEKGHFETLKSDLEGLGEIFETLLSFHEGELPEKFAKMTDLEFKRYEDNLFSKANEILVFRTQRRSK